MSLVLVIKLLKWFVFVLWFSWIVLIFVGILKSVYEFILFLFFNADKLMYAGGWFGMVVLFVFLFLLFLVWVGAILVGFGVEVA